MKSYPGMKRNLGSPPAPPEQAQADPDRHRHATDTWKRSPDRHRQTHGKQRHQPNNQQRRQTLSHHRPEGVCAIDGGEGAERGAEEEFQCTAQNLLRCCLTSTRICSDASAECSLL